VDKKPSSVDISYISYFRENPYDFIAIIAIVGQSNVFKIVNSMCCCVTIVIYGVKLYFQTGKNDKNAGTESNSVD